MIHAPNGMQLTKLDETPKMKCNKRDFDLWRRDEETDSNIGSNGDGSSLEVPRTTDLWKADSAFIHSEMESKYENWHYADWLWLKAKTENHNKTKHN